MPSRARRLRALIALCGVAALLVATAGSAALAAGTGSANPRLLERCVKLMTGQATAGEQAVSGPADPQVAAELSIFRATRTTIDTLPTASDLGQALAGAQATTYDPSASVRLNLSHTHAGSVYAVPATLAAPHLPLGCVHLRSLAGLRVAFALRTQETGTGPGVCLVTTHPEPAEPSIPTLPGKRPFPGTKARTLATAGCESLGEMASYLGALGGGLETAGVPVVLVPDGVSSITAAFANGHQVTEPVTGNLVTATPEASRTTNLGKVTRARLLRMFDAETPVTITEDDAGGTAVATFTRPAGLVPEIVREPRLLDRLLRSSTVSSEDSYVACSARTHHCVAVLVSTSCSSRDHRCQMRRQIERYRYVTRRPPRGTAGPVPTGRIRARVNRYVRHPGRLSLVLSGSPHRRVDVLVEISCFSPRNGGTGSGVSRQPLQVAVPSRTHLVTVGRHRDCGVDALIVSSRPGPIHARLARG